MAQEETAWTDEEGEADEKTIAAMRATYQWDQAVLEAMWDTSKSQAVEGTEG